jgi:hypothetical protein
MPNDGEELDPNHVPPVQKDERLYRRLLLGGWYKTGRPNPIPVKFFMPRPWISEDRKGDSDGLSVSRASLTSAASAAIRPDKGIKCPLAEFGVQDVHRLGLTVVAKPNVTDLGHALIPELNSISQRDPAKETLMKEWAMTLRNNSTLHDA